jgi:hypothetical protein
MKLFVAVVIEGFSESMKEEERCVNIANSSEFQQKWAELDPQATGWLDRKQAAQIIYEISPPFGLRDMTAYPNG